ncbi:hypothetical protein, partial [Neisseria weixii]|uniref:hypothetical protein n=1 Tax=Neisseria weixii TaxID=1853276 RepID=UPI001F47457F
LSNGQLPVCLPVMIRACWWKKLLIKNSSEFFRGNLGEFWFFCKDTTMNDKMIFSLFLQVADFS